ncbi:MAG: hypothetical protein E7296_13065 [Lachnospiraceae bacterium]|jgi:plasmid stabilization system protein ParE|nr:hypothetical protein [Lachnospiraceae bacterium]
MIYKLEYSQIARKKLRSLKKALTEEYGEHAAKEQLTKLTGAARLLERNPNMGVAISELYNIDTDFRYIYKNPNYLFYFIEGKRVIVSELFNEKEDFMVSLFGISGRTQESIDYWGE